MIDIVQTLDDAGYEDTYLIDGFDRALIGVSYDTGAAIYDYDLMVAILCDRDGMDSDEAREYIDYNVIRALPYYDPAPVVMHAINNL
jgi:hypothetical protein